MFLPVQDPVAVATERYALFFCFADRGAYVMQLGSKVVHRALVLFDDVVEVNRCGVCEAALRALLFGLILEPFGAQAALTFSDTLLCGFFIREIPEPRVLSLLCLTDLRILVRHLQLLFPVQGSRERVLDGRGVQTEPARNEIIGAWFVVRGI